MKGVTALMAESKTFCMDCMEAMRSFPDKFFDLAVVDPPYGDGCSQNVNAERERVRHGKHKYHNGTASESASTDTSRLHTHTRNERTTEGTASTGLVGAGQRSSIREKNHNVGRSAGTGLFRGAVPRLTRSNHLGRKLFRPSSDKVLFDLAQVANPAGRLFYGAGMFEAFSSGDKSRFHPTQKPVSLYAWILKRYAQPGFKILYTHLGSGSSRIAAYNAGLDFWGYEIDKVYFDLEEERFAKHAAQINLFVD